MLETCATIDSCEVLLSEQVLPFDLLGQIPFTNNDFEMLCTFVSKELSSLTNNQFESKIVNYPATLSCYLVLRGIFNHSGDPFWKSIQEDIKEFNPAKGQMLGKIFLKYIERNGLFQVEIPESLKYITPILTQGIIPQEQVQEYFDKIIYPLVTLELVCPTDIVEISDWLNENRQLLKDDELRLELSQELEIKLNELPNGECEDPDAVSAEIDALNRQITLLSDKLQALDRPNDLFEKYQAIKLDIVKAKSLETDLLLLEQKNEKVSNSIRTLLQSYEQNPFNTIFPGKISDADSATIYAECELIDYLSFIAEMGSPEEKENLVTFVRSFSEGIANNSIQLCDQAMEKYLVLLSVSMPPLLETGVCEISDISAVHVKDTLAFVQEPPQNELAFNYSDTVEISSNTLFQDIQGLEDRETAFSDVSINTETPADDTLSSDTSVCFNTSASLDDVIKNHPPEDNNHSPNAEMIPEERDELPETSYVQEDLEKDTGETADESVSNDPAASTDSETPTNTPDWTVTQFREQNTSDIQAKTTHATEEVIPHTDAKMVTHQIDAKMVTRQLEAKLVTRQIDDTPDEFAKKPESDLIPSEKTEAREPQAVQKINLFELAGIDDEISDDILSDTRELPCPAKDPVLQNPQRAVLSLADDPKIPKNYKKKSIVSRLKDTLFRR